MTDTPTSNWSDRKIRGRDFVAMARSASGQRQTGAAPLAAPAPSPILGALSMPIPSRPMALQTPAPTFVEPAHPLVGRPSTGLLAETPLPEPATDPEFVEPAPPLVGRPSTGPLAEARLPEPRSDIAESVAADEAALIAPAYARTQASPGKGRRGLALLGGAAVLAMVLAGGWMVLNRDDAPVAASATEGPITPPPAAAAEEGLVGMPVTDTRMPAVPDPEVVAAGEPTPAAATPTSPPASTVRPASPPATREAQPQAADPLPLDISADEPLQVAPQPSPQPPAEPPVQQNWDPFLRGDAPISTAEPPLVVTPPVQDQ